MSDLEEPPAKVLKIDNIGGVTHVTELTNFPEPFDGLPDEEILGEQSGVIEGGADPEQEEWLSEGILTDDDYNPASQETVDDPTDSQLGTGDEEHLDSTLDSEANIAESEANLADSEANMAESEANLADSEANQDDNEANLADSEANLVDNEANLADSEANLADSEANLADNDANIADEANLDDNEENIADNEPILAETEANLADSEANLEDSEANLDDSEANLDGREANLDGCEANLDDSGANLNDSGANLDDSGANLEASEANLDDSEANIVDSEALAENGVNAAEIENNLMEIEANVSLENGIHTVSNETGWTINKTMSQSDANDTNEDNNMSESVEHLMEMSNMDINMESQTYTQESPLKLEPNDTRSGNVSDIVIQRVMTLNKNCNAKEVESESVELNIEETMKHLDEKDDAKSDDFEIFLNKNIVAKAELKLKSEVKDDEDDGNDTDYLLRMLGEDENKGKKKLTKTVKDIRATAAGDGSSDEDDFIYEGSSMNIKNIKAAKNILAKKQPTKAEPEDMEDGDDETEMSADESKTMQKMFGVSSKPVLQRRPPKASPHTVVKRHSAILNVVERPKDVKPPLRHYQNKRLLQPRSNSILKPTTPAPKPPATTKTPTYTSTEVKTAFKHLEIKPPAASKPTLQTIDKKNKEKRFEPSKTKIELGRTKIEPTKTKIEPGRVKIEPGKTKIEPGRTKFDGKMNVGSGIKLQQGKMKVEPEELIDEEEFLDDEEFGLDEDEFAESEIDMSHHRQRIMRPEMMDEEVPSDGESATEDGSLYDELPSSESDDMDDWFTLDIRSEKAGDYIPLLGPKAKELLLEEKRRVSARLSTLKQSHSALISSGKQQAATLRRATATLAELDDMLRAA